MKKNYNKLNYYENNINDYHILEQLYNSSLLTEFNQHICNFKRIDVSKKKKLRHLYFKLGKILWTKSNYKHNWFKLNPKQANKGYSRYEIYKLSGYIKTADNTLKTSFKSVIKLPIIYNYNVLVEKYQRQLNREKHF
jgi:hypothetical protein